MRKSLPKKLRVYLCDLTYDTIILVSDTMPINIGFVGSYMKKMFGEKIDLRVETMRLYNLYVGQHHYGH